jgi:hypothetical protein
LNRDTPKSRVVIRPDSQQDDDRQRLNDPVDPETDKILPDEHGKAQGRGNRAGGCAHDHERGNQASVSQDHDHEDQRQRRRHRDHEVIFFPVVHVLVGRGLPTDMHFGAG